MLEKTNSIKDISNNFEASDHIFDLRTSYSQTSNKSSTSATISSNFPNNSQKLKAFSGRLLPN